jgi:hypothetical protein
MVAAVAAAAMACEGDVRLVRMPLLAQVDFTEPGELSLFIDNFEVSLWKPPWGGGVTSIPVRRLERFSSCARVPCISSEKAFLRYFSLL